MCFICSSGRDKICTVWDLKQQTAKRAIPVYEVRLWTRGLSSYLWEITPAPNLPVLSLSAGGGGCHFSSWKSGFLSDRSEEPQVAFHHCWQQRFTSEICGSVFVCFPITDVLLPFIKGILRVWDPNTARCVFSQTLSTVSVRKEEGVEEEEEKADNPRSLTHLLLMPASSRLATVTAEHNIMLYQLAGLTTLQQVGTVKTHARIFLLIQVGTFNFPHSLSLSATTTRCWTWSSWAKTTATSWSPPTAASWRCLSCSPTAARSFMDTQVSRQQGAARAYKHRYICQLETSFHCRTVTFFIINHQHFAVVVI